MIERQVEDRLAEAVRLRSALGGFGALVDLIIMDEAATTAHTRGDPVPLLT